MSVDSPVVQAFDSGCSSMHKVSKVEKTPRILAMVAVRRQEIRKICS